MSRPTPPAPKWLLQMFEACLARDPGTTHRCGQPSVDGHFEACARHTSLPVRRCSFVELDDDGVLVTCSTETVNASGLCTAHEPQRNPLRGYRPVGLDVRGAR
ncbi:hypothetical protein GCM10027047_01260 [Rhodococcus aerolatus]